MKALGLLLTMTKVTLEPEQEALYLHVMEKLTPAQLERATSNLLASWTKSGVMPMPAEILHAAGVGTDVSLESEAIRSWDWLLTYIARHGAQGRRYAEPLTDEERAKRLACNRCSSGMVVVQENGRQFARQCECQTRQFIDAPSIPPRTAFAVRQLGGMDIVEGWAKSDTVAAAKELSYGRASFLKAFAAFVAGEQDSEQ